MMRRRAEHRGASEGMTPSHEGVEKVRANPADDAAQGNDEASIDRYLDVLKNSLTRAVGSERYRPLGPVNPWRQAAVQAVNGAPSSHQPGSRQTSAIRSARSRARTGPAGRGGNV